MTIYLVTQIMACEDPFTKVGRYEENLLNEHSDTLNGNQETQIEVKSPETDLE